MTRDMRFRFIGLVFYVLLVMNILMTNQVWRSLFGCGNGNSGIGTAQVIIGAVSLGAVLFTSEAMGYLFGTVFLVIWEYFGGWSKVWSGLKAREKALGTDGKEHGRALQALVDNSADPNCEPKGSKSRRGAAKCKALLRRVFLFRAKGDPLLEDVFFSYFWQRAPKDLVDWPLRRSLSVVTNGSIVVALAFAWLASIVPIACWGIRWRLLIPIVFTLILLWALVSNASQNRRELAEFVAVCFHLDPDKWLSSVPVAKEAPAPANATKDEHGQIA
jgi:hypothetical protein